MLRDSDRHLKLILLWVATLISLSYVVFRDIASGTLNLAMAVVMFVIVSTLLILSLAAGFCAISLMALPYLVDRWRGKVIKSAKWMSVCFRTEESIHIWAFLVLPEIRRALRWLMAGPLPRMRKFGDISSMKSCVLIIAWCVALVSHPAPSTYLTSMWTRNRS